MDTAALKPAHESFPKKAFDHFSKKEIIDFLEILHYASQAATAEEVGKVLLLTRRRIPCRHIPMMAGLLNGESDTKPDAFQIVDVSCGEGRVGDAAPLPSRYRPVLEYLSQYLHEALLRIARPSSTEAVDILSPREKTVLNWMRHGKTNWEISRILGVSERTVRFHVEGIFNKLNVTSRTQAVAYAVENRLQAAQ
jgi:DNA-binding CsgD family transcriptional regulator